MTSLYTLTDLSKRYTRGKESITIFEELTMSIPQGDFMAIMGPSGSGKTTLLNLLGGIDRPSSGSVDCEGVRVDKLSEGKLAKWRSQNVGFIFQFYNLMPTLTAAQNVELPLLLTNLSGKARKERRHGAGHCWPGRSQGPPAAPALRRPATARRHRPGHCRRSQSPALRRADR